MAPGAVFKKIYYSAVCAAEGRSEGFKGERLRSWRFSVGVVIYGGGEQPVVRGCDRLLSDPGR